MMGAWAIAGHSLAHSSISTDGQTPLLLHQKPDSVNYNVWSTVTAQMLSGLHLVLTLGPTLAVTPSATQQLLACEAAMAHGSGPAVTSGRGGEYRKGSIAKMFV